jgi:hypothetical protein
VLVFNGYMRSVTAYKVVAAVAGALTGRPGAGGSGQELLQAVQREAVDWPARRAYIVLHNIDGPGVVLTLPRSGVWATALHVCMRRHESWGVTKARGTLLWLQGCAPRQIRRSWPGWQHARTAICWRASIM